MSQNEKAQTTPHFSMQKIYLKKNDYEAPNPASVFKTDWKPEVTLDLDIKDQKLEEDRYEVILSISITAKNAEQVAFRLEVDQAASFLIGNFPDDRLEEALGSACPAIMFPYLRETVDHMLLKGGFPPLMLAPVNFDALYKDKKAQLAQ